MSVGHLPVTDADLLAATNGEREGGYVTSSKNVWCVGPHKLLTKKQKKDISCRRFTVSLRIYFYTSFCVTNK